MIPAYGTVSYNGYTFPATYQLKLSSEPVYTPNTEIIEHYANTLTCVFIISSPELVDNTNAANSVDTEMNLIRIALQQPRKSLSFTYQGAGFVTEITSGTGAVTDDVNGGPLPQVNSWEPIGTNAAARVNWSVTFFSTRCMSSAGVSNILLSYSDEHSFMLNEDGVVRIKRSFKATKKFAITESGATTSVQHIDNNREIFQFNIPAGFRRVKQDYNISANGRVITGEVVDDEEPSNNTPFPYTIKVSGDHTVGSSLISDNKLSGSGFYSWDNAISANIRIAPGYPPALAWQIFLWILYQRFYRIDLANKNTEGAESKNEKGETKKSRPRNILTRLQIKEPLYSREHSFTANYYGMYKLGNLLAQTGLYTPIYTWPDASGDKPWDAGYTPNQLAEWSLWQTSVSDRVLSPLGYRQARMEPGRPYVLFDTCLGSARGVDVTTSFSDRTPTYPDSTNAVSPTRTSTPFETGIDNFLKYQNDFYLVENTRNYPIGVQDYNESIETHKRTTPQDILGTTGPGSSFSKSAVMNNKTITPDAIPRAVLGVGGGSFYILKMIGYAIRQGFWTPAPSVVAFAGREVQRIGTPVYATKQLSEGAAPLYVTKWSIDYLVPFEATGDMFEGMVGNVTIGSQYESSAS